MTKSTRPKRRWYQISLRMLMILMVFGSLGSGWLYVELHHYRANSVAIESLAARQVRVESFHGPLAHLWRICGHQSTRLIERVQYNGYGRRGITSDDQLRPLKELRSLKELDLNNTIITDVTLTYLPNKRRLDSLHIGGTRITDNGLRNLSRLTRLQYLDISQNSEITDEGLSHLKRLKNLTHLNLLGTRVTEAGIQELQTALPDCDIAANYWIWAREGPSGGDDQTDPAVVAN